MLAGFSLVYAAMDTAFFSVLISLGLAESRILPAVPPDTRPRTPFISFCTVQLRTLCAAHSSRPLVQTLGSCPASGAPAMPPYLGRGRVTNNMGHEPMHLESVRSRWSFFLKRKVASVTLVVRFPQRTLVVTLSPLIFINNV